MLHHDSPFRVPCPLAISITITATIFGINSPACFHMLVHTVVMKFVIHYVCCCCIFHFIHTCVSFGRLFFHEL